MDFSSSAKFFREFGFLLTGALLVTLACVAVRAQGEKAEIQGDARATYEAALAVSEPEERVAALQRFVREHPNSEQAGAAREQVVRGLAALGEVQLAERNVERAMGYFKQSVAALPPQVSDKFFDEVASRIPFAVSVRGYRAEAVALAREMEVKLIGDARKLGALGEFYLTVEDAGDSLRVLRIASKLAPEDARLRVALATAYRLNLMPDEAMASFREAIKLEPNEKRAHYELANLERGRGAYEEAVRLYRRQLEIEPGHAGALKGLALAYAVQGKTDLMADALKQSSPAGGTHLNRDFYFQTQLAFTHLARRQIAEARSAADAAVSAEPRFSWARMAAAEVDLAEGKYFEAERNLLAALNYANFPTLHFTLGKVYLTVEDFDGAAEQFAKAFSYSVGNQGAGKFRAKLGGVLELEAAGVAQLLARERQAAIFKAESVTSEVEFQIIEALARLDAGLRANRPASGLVTSLALSASAAKQQVADLERAVNDFVEAESSRRPFRALYAAGRLLKADRMAEQALKLADEALEAAETATAPEGSVRDYPNYDREGRRRVFRGRAGELKGRALIKLNRLPEAVAALEAAVEDYGPLTERSRAVWRLASAKEAAGQEKEALELYLAAYEPPAGAGVADLNRAVIEGLYRKVNGSLDGLDERIGRARTQSATFITFGDGPPPAKTDAQAATRDVRAATDGAPREPEPVAAPTEARAEPDAARAGAENVGLSARAGAKADDGANPPTTVEPPGKKESPAGAAGDLKADAAANAEPVAAAAGLPRNFPPLKIEAAPDARLMLELVGRARPLAGEDEAGEPPPLTASDAAAGTPNVTPDAPNAMPDTPAVELPAALPASAWGEKLAPLAAPPSPDALQTFEGLTRAVDAPEIEVAPDPAGIITRRADRPAAVNAQPPQPDARRVKRDAKLPSEIERRAAAVGLGSGSISRFLALEFEESPRVPPAVSATAETTTEATPAVRARRVAAAPSGVPDNAPATRKRRVTAPRSAAPPKKSLR
jgi:tetratricopeptide (TPR) repeat protein